MCSECVRYRLVSSWIISIKAEKQQLSGWLLFQVKRIVMLEIILELVLYWESTKVFEKKNWKDVRRPPIWLFYSDSIALNQSAIGLRIKGRMNLDTNLCCKYLLSINKWIMLSVREIFHFIDWCRFIAFHLRNNL